jgi:hypothetical protein
MERPWRKVVVPDHVWEAFEAMARDMGNDRDSLISQAMFNFARLNGYLQPRPSSAGQPAAADPLDDILGPAADATIRPPEPAFAPAAGSPPLQLGEQPEAFSEEDDRATRVRPRDTGASIAAGQELVLLGEDGSQRKVVKDRFVIGRGKHCDLVINSSKVSREHALIVREGDAHFIEDLDSSNGTWFDKARIRRRKIQDGDEYFICNERLKCQLLSVAG